MKLQLVTQNRAFSLLKETASDWIDDGALRLSAALAYYSVFSIAPLLIIAISIAGLVLGQEAVTGQLGEQLQGYIGAQAAEGIQSMVQSARKPSSGVIGSIIGFVTLMLGASGIFGQLKDALNTIWEVKPKPGAGIKGFVRERVLNFGMVLVIGFLLLTSLMLTAGLAAINKYLGDILNIPAGIWGVIGFGISFGVVAILFAFIFKVLPDVKIPWKNVWVGAVITALLFEVGKFALSIYLGQESTASSYGAAGSVVLLLLWVYYASCILLFGAEFTQVYAKSTGHQLEPAANAEPVTAEARAQQGISTAKNTGSATEKSGPPAGERSSRIRPALPHLPATVEVAEHPERKLFALSAAGFVLGMIFSQNYARRQQSQLEKLAARASQAGESAAASIRRWRK